VPNKTISLPDDVVPIIESLDEPFSRWVTTQLRRHAAQTSRSLADQLLADAALAAGERPADRDAIAVGERMERSAPW
jgi:hypothetical protein